MQLQRLYMRNFRNYAEASLDIPPGISIIRGSNAHGKTNLLEALYLVSTGRSFRTNHLTDLIKCGESYFYLKAEFIKEGVAQNLQIFFDGQTRKIQINQTDYASFSSPIGLIPFVLHAPEDISLISGTPSDRRRFLNVHIAQTDPLYVHHLLRYHQAMKQRNALLKQKSEAGILGWEQAMATSAAYLLHKRQETISHLTPFLKEESHLLSSGEDTLEIRYIPSPSVLEKESTIHHLASLLQKQRAKELHLGTTLTGPHRDDLLILLNGKPIKSFSSEGQKKSCSTALRFAEWRRLQQTLQVLPVLSLDDFEVHLDDHRQQHLRHCLQNFGQVFLSSPYPKEKTPFPHEPHEIFIENGNIFSS